MTRILLSIAVLLAFITIGYDLAYTSSSGAPTGHTGAPGQGTCLNCHNSSFGLNGGPEVPLISVAGNPTQYTAGQTYSVTVSFSTTTRPRHGFSMVALNASNQNAGTWGLVSPVNTQIMGAGGTSYVTHTTTGTTQTSWSFNWTAPATNVGTVTFYAALNAANANNNNTGDNIYTTSYSMTFNNVVPNAISTSVTGSTFCAGAAVTVGFTAAGTYTAGNVFTAQLSNASGSFASPTTIGTLTGTASGTITATIPAGATAGTGYRIRVVSSTPATTGTDNGSNITLNTVPVVAASAANATLCAGQSTTLTGTGAAAYSWSSGQSGAVVTVSPTTTTTYTATGYNGTCNSTATVTVTVNTVPAPVATTTPVCQGQPLNLTATGTPGALYSWTGPNNFTGTGATVSVANATAAAAGTYSVTQTINGCTSSAGTVAATVNPLPVLVVNPAAPTLCTGQSVGLTATGAGTYSWTPAAGLSTSTGNIVIATPSINTLYTVGGISAQGCISATTVQVNVAAALTVSAVAASATICEGQSTTLTASGGTTYSWSNGQTGDVITVSPAASTVYTVVGSSGSCSSTGTVSVTVNPVPVVSATSTATAICAGSALQITASGATSYSWNTGQSTDTISVSPAANTTYTVTGTTAGCSGQANFLVTVNALPMVSFSGLNASHCSNFMQTSTLVGSPAGGTFAGTGVTGNTFSSGPLAAGVYTVDYTYTDANSCSNTASEQTTVSVCGAVSAAEHNLIKLYPNPSAGALIIEAENSSGQEFEILVMNAMGQTMWQKRQTVGSGAMTLNLPTHLANGLYLIRIRNDEQLNTYSLQLQR